MSEEAEMTIYIDYVDIDKKERTLFNTNEIDYFFEKIYPPIVHVLQSDNEVIPLTFRNPVKELFIVVTKNNKTNDLYDFQKIENLEIKLNNIKLETTDDYTYFRVIQPYFHNRRVNDYKKIMMYSFALDPDSMEPTGSYNFGNLKDKTITIKSHLKNQATVHIYANVNNVLKVKEGQASVQFI